MEPLSIKAKDITPRAPTFIEILNNNHEIRSQEVFYQ